MSDKKSGSSDEKSGKVCRVPQGSQERVVESRRALEVSVLAVQGRSEASRCGVSGESLGDFLSEYFLGCWLSPDPSNEALTCTCGANRARSYLRQERRWQARVSLRDEPEHYEARSLPVLCSTEGLSAPCVLPAPCVPLSAGDPTPEGQVLVQELYHRIAQATSKLTALQQQVLYLHHTQSLSFPQIAAQTGQSPAAARVMAHSALRRLVSLLDRDGLACGEACEYLSLLNRPVSSGASRLPDKPESSVEM